MFAGSANPFEKTAALKKTGAPKDFDVTTSADYTLLKSTHEANAGDAAKIAGDAKIKGYGIDAALLKASPPKDSAEFARQAIDGKYSK